MSTGTRTGTSVTNITKNDVRKVMAYTGIEINTVCGAAAQVSRDFDADSALIDCSLLALNDVISAIYLQFYVGDELIREYAYLFSDEVLEAWGPPPDRPPTGQIPAGARVRLVVTPNPNQPQDYCDGWFRRLGWTYGSALRMPENAQYETYGTFVSGGYGLRRQLLVNPKFDRPIAASASADGGYFQKEQ